MRVGCTARLALALLAALSGLAAWAALGGMSQEPASLPDQATVDKLTALIRKLYKAEFKKSADPKAAQALAATLLQEAKATRDDPPVRYAALLLVRDLATGVGDLATAAAAIDELAAHYPVERRALLLDAITRSAAKMTTAEASQKLGAATLPLIEEALERDDHEEALRLLDAVEQAAKATKNTKLAEQAGKTREKAVFAQKEAVRVKAFFDKLQTAANDPQANLEVGRYLCLVRGKWDKGLQHLAKGSDAVLKALAEKDLANPKDVKLQVALGDGWSEFAAKQKGAAKDQYLLRALLWYQEALPNLDGATRIRIQRDVEYLTTLFPAAAAGLARVPDITGEVRRFESVHTETSCVVVSPDGKLAYSADNLAQTVAVWDTASGKRLALLDQGQGSGLKGVTINVNALAVSSDGKKLAVGNNNNTILLWDLDKAVVERTLSGHTKWVRAVSFFPDGKRLVSAADDGTLRLWDLATGFTIKSLQAHAGFINGMALSKDGKSAVTAGNDRFAKVWDLNKETLALQLEHNDGVWAVAVSPDGKRAVTSSVDKVVRIWDLDTGKEQQRLPHEGKVHSLAFSPDGRWILTGSGVVDVGVFPNIVKKGDYDLRIWDANSGKLLKSFPGHAGEIRALAYAPTGAFVVTGGADRVLRMWGKK